MAPKPSRKPQRQTVREELELKACGGMGSLKSVLQLLTEKHGFVASHPVTVRIRDYYYDSEAWWYYRSGAAFRVRRTGGKSWLTLKSLRSAQNHVACRTELEEALPSATVVNLSKKIPVGHIRKALEECGAPLQVRPLFKLDSRRTFVHCRDQSGQHLLVSVDKACVYAISDAPARASSAFEEIEIEHLEGNPLKTEKLLRWIAKTIPLSPSPGSKFERALADLNIFPSIPNLSAIRPAQSDDRLIDTAYGVLTFHFERLCDKEPGARLGIDPECLHDMRVAGRRLRTALRTFQQALPSGVTGLFEADLRWIAAILAPVRDIDVYLESLSQGEVDLEPTETQLVELYKQDLLVAREQARKQMLAAINSPRYAAFIERYGAFLKRGPARRPSVAMASVSSVKAACVIIQQALDHVERRGQKALGKGTSGRLHRLRIAFKRLRYTCEWFRGHFDSRFEKFIKQVVRMQSLLGAHHDAIVAAARLRKSASDVQKDARHPGLLLLVLGKLIAVECQKTRKLERKFPKTWNKFDGKKAKKRWFLKPIKTALKSAPKKGHT